MEDGNFRSSCRICLQDGASMPIFEKSEKGDDILTKLSLCVNEKVKDVNGFPRHVCSSCNTILDTVSNFIHKFRETTKILEHGLKFVKKEVTFIDNSDAVSDIAYKIKEIKAESDDDFDISLASLVENLPVKKKRIKKESKNVKKLVKVKKERESGNTTNKIASSILEGSFSWSGEGWCTSIGETALKRLKNNTEYEKPRPQTKIKLPETKTEPSEKLCDICGDVFQTQERLSMHKRKVHFKNPVQCPHCQRVCVSEYYLNRHIKRTHEASKDYICSTCGHGFAFQGELNTHFRKVHTKQLRPKKIYSCKFCDKTYKCTKSVVIHERSVHTGQRPAECSICGSCFYHIDYLKEHMRLHTGETPFKCPICGRGYAQRCNMKSHLRIHRISELDAVTLSKLRPNYLKLLKV